MNNYKEDFIRIYKSNIHRDGSEELLSYLERSDFFEAPASTRFHLACSGGLCIHSLNVYDRLLELMSNEANRNVCFGPDAEYAQVEESVAITALLHDLCKVNFYVPGTRNVKNKDTGKWETVSVYEINEKFPMGHGEKTCYIIQNYMKLTPAEGIAIRWHMGGFDSAVKGGDRSLNRAWEKYPLGVCLHVADLLASNIDEVEG